MREINFTADSCSTGKTVGELLKSRLSVSSKLLTELKRTGGILLNGKTATVIEKVNSGDVLSVLMCEQQPSENVVPRFIPIDILYEDEDILAVSKPKDMPIHPSINNYENTLGNAVMFYYRSDPFVYRPVTRLDRDTTGAVIIAKNRLAGAILSEQIKKGEIKKTYIALLSKTPAEKEGKIAAPIKRCGESIIKRCVCENGKSAVTEYKVLCTFNDGSCIVQVHPITGRTHQIRVHMAYIGCPLSYDYLYGTETEGKTFCLHCSALEFIHPVTRLPLKIECPLPDDSELLQRLAGFKSADNKK